MNKQKINIKEILRNNYFELFTLFLSFSLVIFFTFESFLSLKSIPTCIYGCDYYWENGNTLSVMNNPLETWKAGHHIWLNESDNFPSSTPKAAYYLRLPFYLIFDYYESWKGVIIYSLFFSVLSFVGYFLLFKIIFRNIFISLILAFINTKLGKFPYFKYSNIVFLLLPWLILSIYWIFFKFDLKRKRDWVIFFFLLIFFLVFSNLHAWAFFAVFYFLFFTFILKIVFFKNRESKNSFVKKDDVIKFTATFLFTFLLSLLPGWWFYVIFKLKGFNWELITAGAFPDLTQWSNFLSFTTEMIKKMFFNFSSLEESILTISLYIGIFYIFKNFKRLNKKTVFFVALVTTVTLFAVFNYLLTIPIFKKHLSPSHAYGFLSTLFKSLFLGLTLLFIKDLTKNKKTFKMILMLTFLFFFFSSIKNYYSKYDLWFYKNGLKSLEESFPHYKAFLEYLKENEINPNKMVILTTNELSFALYGLTGVQTFNGRLSHFFHFANFQKFWLDSTVILYSKNDEERIRKLKKYCSLLKEKGYSFYLWWDFYWINSEWQISQSGIRPFDPPRFFDKSNWEKLGFNPLKKYFRWNIDVENKLRVNKINYTKADFFFNENFNKYSKIWKIIYVTPDNYYNFTNPWNPQLNKYLEKIWDFKIINFNGQRTEIAALYKINCEKVLSSFTN